MSDDRRSTFAPTLLVGLAAATLSAVATARPMATADLDDVPAVVAAAGTGEADLPLAASLSLVVLAAWGVCLVTRGAVRRAVLALGALAALGVLASLAVGSTTLQDAVAEDFVAAGATDVGSSFTGWFWAAWVGAALSATALVAAVRLVPTWPEIGRRYDTPTGAPAAVGAGEQDDLALWKALDEGHDPTATEPAADPSTGPTGGRAGPSA